MTDRLKPLLLALLAPLLLWGCVITPGKFVSTLTVLADRSFTFTYAGEVWAEDMERALASGDGEKTAEDRADDKKKAAERERKNATIAEALRKEAGYNRVDYLGEGRFAIDYAISGRLTHNFIYPFNVDAQAIIPFLAIELRGKDAVRVKAPAFANERQDAGLGGMMDPTGGKGATDRLDGTFTLVTDAGIVSQNSEDGATPGSDGRRSIAWKATPLTRDAPMAVLKLAPLP
ncbi:hypothetical protein [Sphingomonas sp.]|uniref:hypothetical protein n=1 Tax=Sphingomonas sp. TaxID=28214 RepID=UPI002DD66BA2|nr:hypothetical protein [Sphingomonas sp.]